MLDELKFVRVFSFEHIPRVLFEQVKYMDEAKIKRIYGLGPIICSSPMTLLYVLIDDGHVIHGVLWAEVNPVDAIIFVRMLSVDKEYQSPDGELLKKAVGFLFNLETGPELKKQIHFFTTRPKAFEVEKVGAKRSKWVRMEIEYEDTKQSDTGT